MEFQYVCVCGGGGWDGGFYAHMAGHFLKCASEMDHACSIGKCQCQLF